MLAEQHGADTNFCLLDKDFKLDQIELIRKAGKAILIILCNPNSPTATKIDKNNWLCKDFENNECIICLEENDNLFNE